MNLLNAAVWRNSRQSEANRRFLSDVQASTNAALRHAAANGQRAFWTESWLFQLGSRIAAPVAGLVRRTECPEPKGREGQPKSPPLLSPTTPQQMDDPPLCIHQFTALFPQLQTMSLPAVLPFGRSTFLHPASQHCH